MKPLLSIISVYYNNNKEIDYFLQSIPHAIGKIPYEIIIVDNSHDYSLLRKQNKKNLQIISNKNNIGYGSALNLGAKHAKGKIVLFSNIDLAFKSKSIELLYKRIIQDKSIGVIGPQVLNDKNKISQSIGGIPTLPTGLFVFSFLDRIFPHNTFSKNYWLKHLLSDEEKFVPYVSGVCMVVKKEIFRKIGGFDSNFFMYFEEIDLCKRIHDFDYKVLYFPKSQIIHSVGKSSNDKNFIKKEFEKSRFYFFKKNHGITLVILSEFFLRYCTLESIFIFFLLLTSFFLNTYLLNKTMMFIGDQGWFYLSARDLIINKQIPLVGITASRTWLHQGPFWTYMLSIALIFGKFNPLSGAYLTAGLEVVTTWFLYFVSKKLFDKKVAIFSSLLFVSSPLVITNMRFPYHTSPIPFFVIAYLYSLYKWVKGDKRFLPFSLFILGVLYNFELATVVFVGVFIFIFLIGIYRKLQWTKDLTSFKWIFLSIVFFTLPMFPIILYDIQHGFNQTIKFFGWIVFHPLFGRSVGSYSETGDFLVKKFFEFVITPDKDITTGIAALTVVFTFYQLFNSFQSIKDNIAQLLLSLFMIIPLTGIIISKTPSDAYIPMLLPSLTIMIGIMLTSFNRFSSVICLLLILGSNLLYLKQNVYDLNNPKYKGSYENRLHLSKEIVKKADGKKYNLIGVGNGSQFSSFTMNYEYLTWWMGNAPSHKKEDLRFIINEDTNPITLREEVK